jgi:hypothetical protein
MSIALRGVEAPTRSRQSVERWRWVCQSYTPAALFPPTKIRGTHFSYRLSQPQGHSTAERIRSVEKSTYLIGNRTRDLPILFIVPQPTTLPRAPINELHTYLKM